VFTIRDIAHCGSIEIKNLHAWKNRMMASSDSSGAEAERAARLLKAHPGHVPVIVESTCEGHKLANAKFMVARDMRVAQFMLVLRKRLTPAPPASSALYLFSGATGRIPASAQTMGEVYDRDKNHDKLLMVKLCRESTFG
jgi:hypothetical protein